MFLLDALSISWTSHGVLRVDPARESARLIFSVVLYNRFIFFCFVGWTGHHFTKASLSPALTIKST